MASRVENERQASIIVMLILVTLLILSLLGLIFGIQARNKADQALQQVRTTGSELKQLEEKVSTSGDKASTGAGVGENVYTSPATGNQTPNGNGQ